jgi:hypothetical protein
MRDTKPDLLAGPWDDSRRVKPLPRSVSSIASICGVDADGLTNRFLSQLVQIKRKPPTPGKCGVENTMLFSVAPFVAF